MESLDVRGDGVLQGTRNSSISRFLIGILVLVVLLAAVSPLMALWPTSIALIYGIAGVITLTAIFVARRGAARLAAGIFVVGAWVVLTVATLLLGGPQAPSYLTYFVLVMIAGFYWSSTAALGVAAASIAVGAAIAWAAEAGIVPGPRTEPEPWRIWTALVAQVLVAGALIAAAVRRTESALDMAAERERAARRTSEQLADRVRQQLALAFFSEHAVAETDLDRLFDAALELVSDTLHTDFIKILELAADGSHLRLRAGSGWNAGSVGTARVPNSLSSQAGYTLVQDEPVIVRDLRTEQRFQAPELLNEHGVVSGISVVIQGARGPYGVLAAHQKQPRNFGPLEVQFLASVGHLLGAAVQRSRLEDELRQAQRLEAVGRLAGGVAHDFNNLVTVVSGYADVLVSELDDRRDLRAYAEEISRAAERAAALTRQLLAFSRGDVIKIESLDLDHLVADTLNWLRRLIPKNVVVRLDLLGGGSRVRGDRARLGQVVTNLVLNARDAVQAGGTIEISTRLIPGERDRLRLQVQDDGPGIDAEQRAQVFEPFFTTKRVAGGSGLGLATVETIVRDLGGEIRLDGAAIGGTRVQVELPALPPGDAATLEESRSAPAEREIRAATVLVAEDQPAVRQLIRRALVARGHTVLEASDGEQALAIAGEYDGQIDLLLSDLVMPKLGGRELGEQLVKSRPALRVMLMSGYVGSQGPTSLPEPFYVLSKPFRTDELIARVDAALDADGAG